MAQATAQTMLPKATITVRQAIPADISSWPEMKVRTWSETYAEFGVPQWWLDEPPQEEGFREGFPERIANPARKTWVAYDEVEGKCVGYATAEAELDSHGYIDIRAVYVLTEYQGMGIGKRLVEGVVGEPGRRAVLETLTVNSGARRFYERLGFTR
jgi:GNAT superfamily N-acetyltransferase